MERDVSTKPRDTFEATMRNARRREYQTLAGVLLLIGLALWARCGWRRAPVAALCLGAFAVAYLPISNVFPLNATVAEHWLYVPSAFLFLAAALTADRGLGESPGRGNLRASASLRSLALAVVLWRGRRFSGARTFSGRRTGAISAPSSSAPSPPAATRARMLMNLANVELAAGQPERALALYREALRRAPEQPIIWLGYANVLLRTRRFRRRAGGAGARGRRRRCSAPTASHCARCSITCEDGARSAAIAARRRRRRARATGRFASATSNTCLDAGDSNGARANCATSSDRQSFRAESWKLLGQLLEKMDDGSGRATAYREAARPRRARRGIAGAALRRLSAAR